MPQVIRIAVGPGPPSIFMSYQVLARKWRPRRFDDVVGQPGVTRTLRNAIESGRIAHSYVFAGPRGVGKTTTARILARALNCVKGPTPDPCGECEPCIDIAEGRDIDVLEIDAATHTGIDQVRETIIDTLAFSPVRNRYKIFVIDEVHRLSPPAFDALLKSIEEPPRHVIFMMATTAIDKVPATIQSRSQVFELKAVSLKLIAEHLRQIAAAESLQVDPAAILLIARAADGSVRDALSALDQVVGFAGNVVDAESVATVLGLVGRDLILDIAEAVAAENAPAVFELAGRAVESGHDLRQVCRELARAVRDILVVSVDPSRASDPEIAQEGERSRLQALAKQFSYEDLMRAFDVLARAEFDIRGAAQPRYHLEMALLKWIHLRKLVPLAEVIAGLEGGAPRVTLPPPAPRPAPAPPAPPRPGPPTPMGAHRSAGQGSTVQGPKVQGPKVQGPEVQGPEVQGPEVQGPEVRGPEVQGPAVQDSETVDRGAETLDRGPGTSDRGPRASDVGPDAAKPPASLKDAFLSLVRAEKKFFYGTVVAQAHRIDVQGDQVVFTFTPTHRALRAQLEQHRTWLEGIAEKAAGRRMTVTTVEAAAAASSAPDAFTSSAGERSDPDDLRAKAMKTEGVQALLDVFGAEIKEIEEM